MKISPGAKDWFHDPMRWWRRGHSVARGKGFEIVFATGFKKPLFRTGPSFATWVTLHLPHAFYAPDDTEMSSDVIYWLRENATDYWTVGKAKGFLRFGAFIRNDDDALAFRMRFPLTYVNSGDSVINEQAQMVEHLQLMMGLMQSTVLKGWKIG